MANHTPGPWVPCTDDQHPDEVSIEQDREALPIDPVTGEEEDPVGGIATVYLTGEGVDKDIGEANAFLIAASPDLLVALENLIDRLHRKYPEGFPGWLSGYIVAARSAIADAKGEG